MNAQLDFEGALESAVELLEPAVGVVRLLLRRIEQQHWRTGHRLRALRRGGLGTKEETRSRQ